MKSLNSFLKQSRFVKPKGSSSLSLAVSSTDDTSSNEEQKSSGFEPEINREATPPDPAVSKALFLTFAFDNVLDFLEEHEVTPLQLMNKRFYTKIIPRYSTRRGTGFRPRLYKPQLPFLIDTLRNKCVQDPRFFFKFDIDTGSEVGLIKEILPGIQPYSKIAGLRTRATSNTLGVKESKERYALGCFKAREPHHRVRPMLNYILKQKIEPGNEFFSVYQYIRGPKVRLGRFIYTSQLWSPSEIIVYRYDILKDSLEQFKASFEIVYNIEWHNHTYNLSLGNRFIIRLFEYERYDRSRKCFISYAYLIDTYKLGQPGFATMFKFPKPSRPPEYSGKVSNRNEKQLISEADFCNVGMQLQRVLLAYAKAKIWPSQAKRLSISWSLPLLFALSLSDFKWLIAKYFPKCKVLYTRGIHLLASQPLNQDNLLTIGLIDIDHVRASMLTHPLLDWRVVEVGVRQMQTDGKDLKAFFDKINPHVETSSSAKFI